MAQQHPELSTDRYELTMLASFIADGTVNNRAVFEAFARSLPTGRRYGMVAGIERIIEAVENFTFDTETIDWLLEAGVVNTETAAWLAGFRFSGSIDGMREGDVYFPGTPIVTVTGTLGECVLLETVILSILNHDIAVASAAARMVTAARGRPIIEMGSRRVHEEAAIASARAAYIAGFAATSNLAAGRFHGVPTTGTAAHAFTLAHRTELDAFRAQINTHGVGTTLLVDTYDIAEGIRNAVTVAREHGATGPGAIRIDSGDLAEETAKARTLLDELGATDTRITITSDLDEYAMADLANLPVDGYGAGTRVATGSGHPTAKMVYKLVAIADSPGHDAPMRRVAKKAAGKGSVGGRKHVWRTYDTTGQLTGEYHAIDNAPVSLSGNAHVAQVPLVRAGRSTHSPSIEAMRKHAAHALASLPIEALELSDGPATVTPVLVIEDEPDKEHVIRTHYMQEA